jgi:tRNA U34 5-carboxymethylaminomethyl modifying GTPase MnmE/TrmE
MDSVFALEKTLHGGGRYVWEAYTQVSIQSDLRAAQQGLNTFRSFLKNLKK